MLACVNCSNPIILDPSAGRLPPWCPNCGADLKLTDPKPAVLDAAQPANAPTLRPEGAGAPVVETTLSTFEPIESGVEAPWLARLFRNGAVLCLLGSTALAYFTPMDTWLWPLVMAGSGCTMLLFWARLRSR